MRRMLPALAGLLWTSNSLGATFHEDFASDPAARGWSATGEPGAFQWNAAGQHLEVTWDSSKPNSYFHRALGTVLAKTDDVTLAFDLQLDEVEVGTTPGKPFTFELAVALLNWRDATGPDFVRGTGNQSPNLMELDYFPDSGFGATISPLIVSSNNQFRPSFTFPFELTRGDLFHFELRYSGLTTTLTTLVWRNGQSAGPIKDVTLLPDFTDFRIDTLAVCGYNDAGAGGSVRARGRIDNVSFVLPEPPISGLRGTRNRSGWQVSFTGRPGWSYALERTEDWRSWLPVSEVLMGTGTEQVFTDDGAPVTGERAFYRVRSERL